MRMLRAVMPGVLFAAVSLPYSAVAFQARQDASCIVSGDLPAESSDLSLEDNFAGIITVQSFFDSATCQKYRETPLFPSYDGGNNVIGDLIVESLDMEKMVSTFTALGKRDRGEQIHNDDEAVGLLTARHTYLETSTMAHRDHYAEGILQGQPVTGSSNAFVFLNTNPDALFFHGGATEGVPVVEGTLVVFDGAVSHYTHVPRGTVHLLGPLNTNTLQRVGTAPAPGPPTAAPPSVPCNSTGTFGFAVPVGPLCFEANLIPLGVMVTGLIASFLLCSVGARPNET
jgi:hypothetical protein